MDPDPDPDLTIILLGNSGVGKSASGNTILGRTEFESRKSFASVTRQICKKTGNVFGKQISVVDTPGILGSEGEIQTYCQELLQSSTPCSFLVVVKIDRFTIEQKNTVEAAIRVIGDDGFKNCYLLFTGGDGLGNMTLDDFINKDPEGPLRPLVDKFEDRYHVFNNAHGGQEQVRELLEEIRKAQNVTPPSTDTHEPPSDISGHPSGHPANPSNIPGNPSDVPADLPARRIVLLGLPGVGKSSSGNTILGSDQFHSAGGFNPVSEETVSESATVEGCRVTVADTPGITGKVMSARKLFGEIIKSVEEAKPGPHAFVIVVKLARITQTEIKLFELIEKLFSKDAPKYTVILFTYADELKDQPISTLIKENKYVSGLVSKCGGRYCVFDNTKRGNREQVKELLDKIDNIFRANTGTAYTPKMFLKVQAEPLKTSIKIRKAYKWFKRWLNEVDTSHPEYTPM